MAVAIEREGARIGGVSRRGDYITLAVTARGNTDTDTLAVEIFHDAQYLSPADAITSPVDVSGGSDYRIGTIYATIPAPENDQFFYWRLRADGVGGSVYGQPSRAGFIGAAGRIRTPPLTAGPVYRVGWSGCFNGYHGRIDSLRRSEWASATYGNIINGIHPDAMGYIGDMIYADVGGLPSPVGTPYDVGAAVTMQRADGYSSWHTVPWWRQAVLFSLDAPVNLKSRDWCLGQIMGSTPGIYMPDDHDWAVDSPGNMRNETRAWMIELYKNGHAAMYENFLGMNLPHVETEGRAWRADSYLTREPWYYVDYAPVRYLVTDNRTYADAPPETDSPTRSILGATQKSWLLDQIRNSPQPIIGIVSPLAYDGDHTWNPGHANGDTFKFCSYERDEILNACWASGKLVFVLSFDSHAGYVARYRGPGGDKRAIYELMASNNWFPSNHGYNTGFSGKIRRPNETQAATGWGGEDIFHTLLNNVMSLVESGQDRQGPWCRLLMIETYPAPSFKGGLAPRVVWSSPVLRP